ncbi:MAG: hypothetical protein B7733_07700 [Myxococcales bacterium FL481]|nr:MAG: hypothetical protein B7733_07700 [Myxococcales bacterium FL481]
MRQRLGDGASAIARHCGVSAVVFAAACCGSEPPPAGSERPNGPIDPGGPWVSLTREELFDPNRVLHVEIEMLPADWEALRTEHPPQGFGPFGAECHPFNHAFRYRYRPATVTLDGHRVERAGVRKKAYCGSEDQDKPGLKLAFDKYAPSGLEPGIRRLTLNNAVQDPSYVRQCLGLWVFARAGLPASRCNFAVVRVNGGDPELYVHVERLDNEFLRRSFGSTDGDLYEGTLSDFDERWLPNFEHKRGPGGAEARLVAASRALADESRPALTRVGEHFHLDSSLRFWAVEVLMAAWDGYHSNQNNYFIYLEPSTDRLRFAPWGVDHVLSNLHSPAVRTESYLSHFLYRDDAGRARYYETLDWALAHVWHESALSSELERLAGVVTRHVPTREISDVEEAIEHTRDFIRRRREVIAQQLANGPLDVDPNPPRVPELVELGSVAIRFETTWDSLGSPAAAIGSATVDGAVEGYQLAGARAGASVGRKGGNTRLSIDLALSSGEDLHVFAVGPREDPAPGAELTPNYTGRWRGGLSRRRPSDDKPYLVARLIDARLQFDAYATEPGAEVRGFLQGRIVRIE